MTFQTALLAAAGRQLLAVVVRQKMVRSLPSSSHLEVLCVICTLNVTQAVLLNGVSAS